VQQRPVGISKDSSPPIASPARSSALESITPRCPGGISSRPGRSASRYRIQVAVSEALIAASSAGSSVLALDQHPKSKQQKIECIERLACDPLLQLLHRPVVGYVLSFCLGLWPVPRDR